MRIAITGKNRATAVERLSKELGVEPIKIDQPNLEGIFAYAAESFQHYDEENVLFDGSVLDFVGELRDYDNNHRLEHTEGEILLKEQVVICGLLNYDKIFIISEEGEENEFWENMRTYYPNKVTVVNTPDEVVL